MLVTLFKVLHTVSWKYYRQSLQYKNQKLICAAQTKTLAASYIPTYWLLHTNRLQSELVNTNHQLSKASTHRYQCSSTQYNMPKRHRSPTESDSSNENAREYSRRQKLPRTTGTSVRKNLSQSPAASNNDGNKPESEESKYRKFLAKSGISHNPLRNAVKMVLKKFKGNKKNVNTEVIVISDSEGDDNDGGSSGCKKGNGVLPIKRDDAENGRGGGGGSSGLGGAGTVTPVSRG